MNKPKQPREECPKCGNILVSSQLSQFSWRYTAQTKIYAKSKRKWIHTGRIRLCYSCIKETIKSLNIPF